MATGLAALLDDVATLAKIAATSLDDVGSAVGKASGKAAGLLVDDAAVTPRYVHDFTAERELPLIAKIAKGSLKNKLLFILPAAIILSQFLSFLLSPLLMIGGLYLSYEGVEKIWEKLSGQSSEKQAKKSVVLAGVDNEQTLQQREEKMVAGAVRTDFILSAEIMVIALKEVAKEPLFTRVVTLIVVALAMTALVYGVVALIVKADDFGLHLAETTTGLSSSFGQALVKNMPKFLQVLTVVGIAAMTWVGGHILLAGFADLGWHWPYDQVHHIEELAAHSVSQFGAVLGWLSNTLASALFGIFCGAIAVSVMHLVPHKKGHS